MDLGQGIINSDGELWKVQRKAGLAFLNTKNLQVLTDVALPQYLSQSIEYLKATAERSREVDLQAVFHEITTQLMGKMAYNMNMHGDDEFTLAFDYASGATAERVQNPLWRITEIFFGAGLRRSVAIVKAFGKRIVDSAIEEREKGQEQSVDIVTNGSSGSHERLDQISGSLIQSLLDSLGDREMVADAALNYLSAGRDTTAQALTWTFHLLMHNRYATGKIRREIRQLLGRNEAQRENQTQLPSSNSPSLPIDPALLTPTSMPYTLAVFNEALRLYPPIPFEMRQAQTPITLPDGTFLPKDSVVIWCLWATNRSRLTWGEDADLFRPERWLASEAGEGGEERVRLVQKSASEFPVFNGGPRTCLGKKMAELIAVQVIASVVWAFEFVPVYEGRERSSKSSLTLPMEGGLPVLVKVRPRVGDDEDHVS
ncbi:Cytochrome P450 94A1 [Cytospora mali]|uniref:Cytochrome P450 94A1 n=1 Tax=Cytospora mali TaxID=578113 RepID=A0A194VZI8_CYTMA|nr:Cytochrome P450 94A1 [Valsa mali]